MYNREQKKAISHDTGPVIIMAGAGTGKTLVLTKRIARIIQEKKALPEEVLALTFTEKAAQEMQERVEGFLPQEYQYSDFWISTFHSFCERILRIHAIDIGLSNNFKIIDEIGAWMIFKKNIASFDLDYYRPKGSPNQLISAMISHISRCKDDMILPEDYPGNEEIKKIYAQYQKLLIDNNYLDFGDIINYCIELFETRPKILKKYQKQFKYLLIDEFQDTNKAQYKLIKMLSNNVMICLDPNQSIYRFRGASFDNFRSFENDYPRVTRIILNKNYRSYQNILDLAYNFNKKGIKLKSQRRGKGIIKHLHYRTVEEELYGIGQQIKGSFSNYVILTRTNADAQRIYKALNEMGFPVKFWSLKGLYQKDVIIDIISYFQVINNQYEDRDLYRVLNFPFFKIKPIEISGLTYYAKKKSKPLYEALKESKHQNIVKLIEKHSKEALEKDVSEVFINFLNDSGYLNYLEKNNRIEDFGHINQFYDRIKRFENKNRRLASFMEELNLELESGNSGEIENEIYEDNSVKVMTVHSAKGLEFRYVIIANMVEQKFPSNEKSNAIELSKDSEDTHMEEERRLFYVAITRAKDGIFFTSAENYNGVRKRKISRFLREIGFNDDSYEKININLTKKNHKKEIKIKIPDHFSYTQLAAYSRCPYQYYLAHMVGVPRIEGPASNFGKSIHNTIAEITKNKDITIKEALLLYDQNWIDDWYQSDAQKKTYYTEGKQIIKKFTGKFIKEKPNIKMIEQSFEYDILKNCPIHGKIDRVDEKDGGVEIIDYKTGSYSDQLKADKKEQLLIYQIVAENLFKLTPIKLTYYYLSEDKKISFLGKEKDKARLIDKIKEQVKEIRKGNFRSNPGWHCQYCDFINICKYAKKR